MKKLLFLLLSVLLFSSCDGNFSYQEDLTTKQIVNLKIDQDKWTLYSDGINKYYSSYVRMDELTSTIYNHGGVIAYIDYDDHQQVLPYVRHHGDAKGNLWTTTIDYEVEKGGMTFYVTNSDFLAEAPETMYIKVILFW